MFKSELPVATDPVDGQSTTVSEIENILNHSWRLPDFARNFRYHRGYTDVRGELFAYAICWIGWKINFLDPTIKHDFPSATASLVKGLIHLYRTPKAGRAKQAWNAAANVREMIRERTISSASTKGKNHGQTELFNRKSIVPPGFCFVKFNCCLNVAVAGVNIPPGF